ADHLWGPGRRPCGHGHNAVLRGGTPPPPGPGHPAQRQPLRGDRPAAFLQCRPDPRRDRRAGGRRARVGQPDHGRRERQLDSPGLRADHCHRRAGLGPERRHSCRRAAGAVLAPGLPEAEGGLRVSRRRALYVTVEVLVPVLAVAAWWWTSSNSTSPYFPPLSDIVQAFRDSWVFRHVPTDAVPSLARMGAGYGIAVVVGISLGMVLG